MSARGQGSLVQVTITRLLQHRIGAQSFGWQKGDTVYTAGLQ